MNIVLDDVLVSMGVRVEHVQHMIKASGRSVLLDTLYVDKELFNMLLLEAVEIELSKGRTVELWKGYLKNN